MLLSADVFLAAAGAANVSHQNTETAHQVSPASHGTFQDHLTYQPVESGGMFEGVSAQAIQSQEPVVATSETQPGDQVTEPAVQAKTVTATTASASSNAKVSTVAATFSATFTASAGSVATQQLTASLNVANAPPVSTVSAQSANNQSVVSNSNSSSNSNASSSTPAATSSTATSTVDLFLSVNNALNAIATGTTPAPINLPSASLGGVLTVTGVQITFAGLSFVGGVAR